MTFQHLSGGAIVAGLAGIGAILYMLQRLRVRHREMPVVTTLFWKEAIQEARARVFVRRFRHFPAYLLFLAIAALLWLGLAGPRTEESAASDYVLLLDGSAGMAYGDRFERAAAEVRSYAARLPRDRTRVVLCGARARTLLAPGEDRLVLARRLEPLRPEACPATVEAVLGSTARWREARDADPRGDAPAKPLTFVLFGDAPVRAAVLDALPEGVRVERVALEGPARSGNRGITALGVSEAASGAFDRVDVLVEARGPARAGRIELAVTLDGQPLTLAGERTREADRLRVLFRDVPARGQRLAASLVTPDALSVDDEAAVQLPNRRRIRVAVDAGLADRLGPVLAADPAAVLSNDRADVSVRTRGASPRGREPTLELVPEGAQTEAILLVVPEGDDPERALAAAFTDLGLDLIDADSLADGAARPIEVGAVAGPARGIRMWASLFTPKYNFLASRAFPLFVAKAVRWLHGDEAIVAYAAAGEPVAGLHGVFRDDRGRALDAVGLPFTPPRAGTYEAETGAALAVSLLDPALVAPPATDAAASAAASLGTTGGPELVTWIVLAAFLLLLVEWHLHRTGRVP